MTRDLHELEDLERQGWRALSGTSGEAFYDQTMADDGLMVFPGAVLDKHESLLAIASASPWQTFELSDLRVVTVAEDVAFITYSARAVRSNASPYQAVMTSLYRRAGNRWQLVLHQQSP
jgi:hypothetical protein